jgi:hypothetical protein
VELYTVGRDFNRKDPIDTFHSAIWTERYYGDSEFELVVPGTPRNAQILPPGIFLALKGTQELMIAQGQEFTTEKTLKVTGISVLKWLNNRFVRTSAKHEDRYWYINDTVGQVLQNIVYLMCVGGGYLDGSIPTGIPNPWRLKVPGLHTYGRDTSGDILNIGVPYGPVFDALYEIATTYEIGQRVDLIPSSSADRLRYSNYRGIDRTSGQNVRPPVRFSSSMDSLTDISEIQSIAAYKTEVYAFAPGLDEASKALATTPGINVRANVPSSGFDLLTQIIFAEDITTDQVGGDAAKLLDILNSRAKDTIANTEYVKVVDGEIVPTAQFKYGRDYNLGDLIEIQGNSGIINKARVTEYIRTQDETGERAYPTVSMKDS